MLDVQTLIERAQLTQEFLNVLKEQQLTLFGTNLKDQELLAIAQHYGFATPLLDYTKSLQVAAYFATRGAQKLQPNEECIGVIYYINAKSIESNRRDNEQLDAEYDLGKFSLLNAARIRLGTLQVIEPNIPDEDNRIARQKGVFIEGYQVRDLQNFALSRLHFRQQPGEVYEDPSAGITEKALLSDLSKVNQIAEEVKERFNSTQKIHLHSTLGATRVPENTIIGSGGEMLLGQILDAKNFFEELRRQGMKSSHRNILQELGEVFKGYFLASQTLADIGELPTDDQQKALNPFEIALAQVAKICEVDETGLWNAVAEYLPRNFEYDSAPVRPQQNVQTQSTDTDVRIALACSLYLAGWEHLKHVQGRVARELTLKARTVLGNI